MANYIPREFLNVAERIIKEYAERVEELRQIEETLKAACRSVPIYGNGTRGTYSDTSEPELLLEAKNRHPHYRNMERCIELIRSAMDAMTPQERRLMEQTCWKNMSILEVASNMEVSLKDAHRMKQSALKTAVPHIFAGSPAFREIEYN